MPHKRGPKGAAVVIDRHVGNKVRRRRELIGMSQDQLADHLGLSFQQIQKYENGTNRISAGRLLQIADFLGISVESLFDGLLRDGRLPTSTTSTDNERVLRFAMSREGMALSEAYLNAARPDQRKLALDVLRLPMAAEKP